MALTSCPECGREVSDRASACPGCAFPLVAPQERKRAAAPPPNDPPTFAVISAMVEEIDFKKGVALVFLIAIAVGAATLTVSLPALGVLLALGCITLAVVARLGKPAKLGKPLGPHRELLDASAVTVFCAVAVGFFIYSSQQEQSRQKREAQLQAEEAARAQQAELEAFLADAPNVLAAAEDTLRDTGLLGLMEQEDYDAVVAICDEQIPMARLKRISDYRPDNAQVARFITETGSVCNKARQVVAQKKAIAEAEKKVQRQEQEAKETIANTKAAIAKRYPDPVTADDAYKKAVQELARVPEPALSKRRAQIRRLNAQLERKRQAVMYKALLLRYERDGVGHVKASTLRRAFDKNEVDAERRYTGREFLVEGVISSINTSLFNTAVVLLRTGAYFSDFHGRLRDRGDGSGLRRGQRVILHCKIDTAIIGSPTGSDCEVVMWWGGRD